jgi:hypothetical protein
MQQKPLQCPSAVTCQQKCKLPASAPLLTHISKKDLHCIALPWLKSELECILVNRAMETAYEAKASMADETYGDEDYTLGGKVAYPGSSTPRSNRGNAAFFRRGGGGRTNNRVPMRGGNRSRGRGKRSSNGDSSGGESDGGGYGPSMDGISNGNGGRGGRRRSNQRPVGSAALSGRGRGASRGRGAGRARGRIGRGLSQAAEALLGMGGEYDQDEAMTVSAALPSCIPSLHVVPFMHVHHRCRIACSTSSLHTLKGQP